MEDQIPGPFAMGSCNCLSLRKASRRISQYYDARLAPSGLRATQFAMLALVRERGAQSINAIAARLDMDRTTTGQNLRPLERAGLVTLTRSPTDGRGRDVDLTDVGRAALDIASPLWRAAQDAFERCNGADPSTELRARLGGLRFE